MMYEKLLNASPLARALIIVFIGLIGFMLFSLFHTEKTSYPVDRLSTNPAGKAPVVIDYNEKKRLLSIAYETGLVEFINIDDFSVKVSIHAFDYRVTNLSFANRHNIAVTSSYFSDTTKLWDYTSGNEITQLPNTRGPEVFYLDSSNLILAANNKLRIYDIKHKAFYPIELQCGHRIRKLSVSPKGKYLV